MVKNKIEREKQKFADEYYQDLQKYCQNKTFKIPEGGMKLKTVNERLKQWVKRDDDLINAGKTTGAKYLDNPEFESQMKEFCKDFLYHNPLHFDIYSASRQMEAEIISMTSDLFHCEGPYGVISSGGTESICMAILAYRCWGKENKGITKPNIVAPVSCHAAFEKACFYFNIEYISVPLNPKTYEVDINKMKKAINKNTICVIGSCPNFPHGIVDPLDKIGQIAKKKQIGFHVDCCLGSFVSVFSETFDLQIPSYDFRNPGITSISCDHHKYGYGPKGVSIVMYRNSELRRYSFYSTSQFQGGLYVTPGFAGSRSSAPLAGAWFSLVYHGLNGLKRNAQMIIQATNNLKKAINQIEDLQVIGNPQLCVVSFISTNKKLSIYQLHYALTKKNWNLSALQKPEAIHIAITQLNAKRIKELVNDIKFYIEEVKKNPSDYKKGSVAIYGTAKQVPEKQLLGEFTKVIQDVMLKV